MKNPGSPEGRPGASESDQQIDAPSDITRTDALQPSLFTTPPSRGRRRHRKRHYRMALVATPAFEREQLDREISATWREAYDRGCDADSWLNAGFFDSLLRYRRALIGRASA